MAGLISLECGSLVPLSFFFRPGLKPSERLIRGNAAVFFLNDFVPHDFAGLSVIREIAKSYGAKSWKRDKTGISLFSDLLVRLSVFERF